MLTECKKALRITADAYDGELCALMDAAVRDLGIAGVIIPGTVSFSMTQSGITDGSTLTDPLVMRAVFTYVRMHFGSPADYDRLAASYDLQRRQLANATGYTNFGKAAET